MTVKMCQIYDAALVLKNLKIAGQLKYKYSVPMSDRTLCKGSTLQYMLAKHYKKQSNNKKQKQNKTNEAPLCI